MRLILLVAAIVLFIVVVVVSAAAPHWVLGIGLACFAAAFLPLTDWVHRTPGAPARRVNERREPPETGWGW